MKYDIVLIAGDGVGPEIMAQAEKVLNAAGKKFNHEFNYEHLLAGGMAIDEVGVCLPEVTLEKAQLADGILLGAVGGPKWDGLPGDQRPEKAILGLREKLGLFANLRPAVLFPQLKEACPLKNEIIADGLDIMVVRELTGGIYFGERGICQKDGSSAAYDVEVYSEAEVERIAQLAFSMAMKRDKRLVSVDKANVLNSSRLWRRMVDKVGEGYPEVELSHMYVDNAAMQLVRNPRQFDCIVTSNMFGDILSDEASMIVGSIGMLPSASLRNDNFGLYEPIHGSAPDIANKDMANPIGMILSVAMMLKYSFGLTKEALAIEKAVNNFLDEGYRTLDIMSWSMKKVGTKEAGDLIAGAI